MVEELRRILDNRPQAELLREGGYLCALVALLAAGLVLPALI